MKYPIYIISLVLAIFSASCSDKSDLEIEQDKEPGTCSVTISLSFDSGNGFTVGTRSVNSRAGIELVDFETYDVYMYWFDGTDTGDEGKPIYKYDADRSSRINDHLVTIDGLTEGNHYAYLFVAALKGTNTATMISTENSGARDMGQAEYLGADAGELIGGTSSLMNCYFPFFAEDESEQSNMEKTGFDASKVHLIYADGARILAGLDFTTPYDVVLNPQFGIVQIRANQMDFSGSDVTCVVNSDFYRLYFDQMMRWDRNGGSSRGTFTSFNEAHTGDGDLSEGDYFSIFSYDYNLAVFTWEKKGLTTDDMDSDGNINIYLPYTTANEVGSLIESNKHTVIGPYESELVNSHYVSLTITQDGESNTYHYDTPFPIYRGGISYFNIEGTVLSLKFADDAGNINLDDDKWDGIVTDTQQ